jgi:hypothetical protein
MKIRLFSAIVFVLMLSVVYAQDAPPAGQNPAQGPGAGGWQGQRGGRGGRIGGMGGRGVMGTVTEVAADHYTIKTETGETYTVHFSVNTRIIKQSAQRRGDGQGGEGAGCGGGNPPQTAQIHRHQGWRCVAAMGEVDAAAKSIGAVTLYRAD